MAEIQDVAKKALELQSVSDLQYMLNDGAKQLGKKTLRGTLQITASGFGKGLLIAVGVVIAAMAFSSGVLAMDAGLTFATGMAAGVSHAISFLTSGAAGLATLGIGGALGSVMETRKHQNEITAEMARLEANIDEVTRAKNQTPTLDKNKSFAETDNTPCMNHAARETERRKSLLCLVKQ